MKEGNLFVLFCLYLRDPPNRDALGHVLDLFGKLSRRRGASAWFHGIWTCSVEVLEYWMISSLKIKLNHSWKFWRNWNVPLVLVERSQWAGFNGIYLVRLDSECGRFDFEMISAAENSIKFQKTRFWKEKSVEDEFTFGPTAQATLVYYEYYISLHRINWTWTCEQY